MVSNSTLMRPSNILSSIFLLALFAGLFQTPVEAASTKPLTVSPGKIEISGMPGQKIKSSFVLSNGGNLPVRMKLSVKNFRQSDEKGTIDFYNSADASSDDASVVDMGKVLIPEFLEIGLKPGELKQVNFIVSIPDNIKSGGYYGAILFESANDQSIGPKNSFGGLVLLTVLGGEGQAAAGFEASNFRADKIQQKGPARFSLAVNNPGNTHIDATGVISIKNWRNKEIASFDIGSQPVYPGEKRIFNWSWNKKPNFGFYRIEAQIAPLGHEDQKFSGTTWFFAFPWALLPTSLVVAGMVIVAGFLFLGRKKIFPLRFARKKRNDQKDVNFLGRARQIF
jgi:hypothetical protein